MDGGVWERVLAQQSRVDAGRAWCDTECCTMQASLCHMTSGTFQGGYCTMSIAQGGFF